MFDYTNYIHFTSDVQSMSKADINADIEAINTLFVNFGIAVTSGRESYTTMQYRLKLKPDCNISKILKMQQNLCIALDDDTVRLYRDRSELVIEKKGKDNLIRLGDLYTDEFKDHKGLYVMLGYSVDGKARYVDLIKAPHMLIAGTTGSGKSVTVHTIICSLLMKYPNLEIYGIDPKRVEFSAYRNAPNFHYITEPHNAIITLSRLCEEMERRYNVLAKARVNDIEAYNTNGGNMGRIVVVIDEFADLIQSSNKNAEGYIVRLAQKARACGIHLVIATQRPTRDVITGLIKANIPTKICLKVTSALDSRIVMDRNGGECLVGKGDMLYLGNGDFEPTRIQGVFVDDAEMINISVIARHIVQGTPIITNGSPVKVDPAPDTLPPAPNDIMERISNLFKR